LRRLAGKAHKQKNYSTHIRYCFNFIVSH